MEHEEKSNIDLKSRQELVQANRNAFRELGLTVVSLVSSPHAGKTSILEQTLPVLKSDFNLAVIEGDLHCTFDAERIRATGVPVWQIVLGTGCHVDASSVAQAIEQFPLAGKNLLVIERIGDPGCPEEFDLGEDLHVMVYSVADEADAPRKCPAMCRAADAVVLNKTDLLPRTGSALDKLKAEIRRVNPIAAVFPVSCRTRQGVPEWIVWLRERLRTVRKTAIRKNASSSAGSSGHS